MTTQSGDIFQNIREVIDTFELDYHNSRLYIGDKGWPAQTANGYEVAAMQKLLRRYEPVLYFDTEEQFFPMSAMVFMFASRIWTNKKWKHGDSHVDADFPPYLRNRNYKNDVEAHFAPDQPSINDRLRDKLEWLYTEVPPKHRFHMHFSDNIRLKWLYGLIPFLPRSSGRQATAKYKALTNSAGQRPCYYGRIAHYVHARDDGTKDHYRVLQYWFFYAFNDWSVRWISKGLNWHEGDWESISIIGRIPDGGYADFENDFQPIWTAYAAHKYKGNQIRRCWDKVERIEETHPVVYVSRGAHGSYYTKGKQNRKLGIALDSADGLGKTVAPEHLVSLLSKGGSKVTAWAEPRIILDKSNFPELQSSDNLPRHWLTLNSNWGSVPGELIKDMISSVYKLINKISRGRVKLEMMLVRLQDGPEGLLDPERATSRNFIKWAGIDKVDEEECQEPQ